MSLTRLILTCVLLVIGMPDVASVSDPQLEAIATQIERLAEQAARCQSAKAELNVTFRPTSPEAVKLIATVNQARLKDPQYRILSPERARDASYRLIWQRQGANERHERTYRNGDREVLVFDRASVYRWLHRAADGADAWREMESEEWVNAFHVQPWALAFEYRGQQLSEFIRRSPERDLARGTFQGQARQDITAENPAFDDPRLRLSFDSQGRLVAREAMVEGANYLIEFSRNRMRLFTRHEFSAHQSFDDGRGHAVWFPRKADLHYYVGSVGDQQPVEQFGIEVELIRLELNVPIEDSAFELVVPPGVRPKDLKIFTPFLEY